MGSELRSLTERVLRVTGNLIHKHFSEGIGFFWNHGVVQDLCGYLIDWFMYVMCWKFVLVYFFVDKLINDWTDASSLQVFVFLKGP